MEKNKNAKVEAYDYIFHHFSCFLTAFINFGLYIDHLDTATDINLVKRLSPSLKNHSLKNLRVHKLSAKDQALYWKAIHVTNNVRNCVANHIIPNYDYIFHHFSCFLTAFINFGLYIDNLDTATAINLV